MNQLIKVLVTGSNGQLGLSIKRLAVSFPEFQMVYTDVEELDISNEIEVKSFFVQNTFDIVINCAAYTAVDKAETEKEKAFLINSQAVKNLAICSKEFGFLLIHISTDFIFDGLKTTPYIESDSPNPLSIYGLSKLDGENNVIRFAEKAIIIRTSWLYSEYGNNFLKTIQRIAAEKEEINVVNDQVGTPTYAGDLAEVILKTIKNKFASGKVKIYHFSNDGIASWFDFASAIVELSNLNCAVKPIPSSAYPLQAKRPAYSVLDKSKIKKEVQIEIPDWKESLEKCIANMK
jgi:dTDP-4-dehydrorhamnose reductase